MRLSFVVFVGALSFLTFVWGVAATTWEVFPHRQINRVMAGMEAWRKLERRKLPLFAIDPAPGATKADPVTTFEPAPSDDLLLITGGFYFRQDICPKFGCMAYVMTRDGKVLHAWEFDPDALLDDVAFAKFKGTRSLTNLNVLGVDIDADGNLIAVFQGLNMFPYQIGVAKFTWKGALEWLRIDNSHHWPKVGKDGRIYTPIARIVNDAETVAGTNQTLDCKNGAVYQEGVQILAPDGTEIRRFWLDKIVQVSDMQGLAYAVRSDCDPYHVNGIDLLNAAAAARMPGTREGDLLVSLRSSSSLVVMDQTDGQIKRVIHGPMVAQHSPWVLPDGRIALFDNLGGADTKMGTRILVIDPATRTNETLFPRLPGQPGDDLLSEEQGVVTFSADGTRLLVSETLGGRIFEVDAKTGQPLWQMNLISDLRPFYERIGVTPPETTMMRIQAQGARYITAASYTRWASAPPTD